MTAEVLRGILTSPVITTPGILTWLITLVIWCFAIIFCSLVIPCSCTPTINPNSSSSSLTDDDCTFCWAYDFIKSFTHLWTLKSNKLSSLFLFLLFGRSSLALLGRGGMHWTVCLVAWWIILLQCGFFGLHPGVELLK